MGRPGRLCGLCPDSKINRSFTVSECELCPGGVRYCAKHIVWSERGWICKRCDRRLKKEALKQKAA